LAKPRKKESGARSYARVPGETPVKVRRSGRKVVVEFSATLSDASVLYGVQRFLKERGE
jgi:hypothetical protein